MWIPRRLGWVSLLSLATLAQHEGNDASVEDDSERAAPRANAAPGVLSSKRPADAEANARLQPVRLSRWGSGKSSVLEPGMSYSDAPGKYTVDTPLFGGDIIDVRAGASIDVSPVYLHAELPTPFESLHIDDSHADMWRTSAATWIAVPRSRFSSLAQWSLRADNGSSIALRAPNRSASMSHVDLSAALARVQLEFDDDAQALPLTGNLSVSAGSQKKALRELPAAFFVAPHRELRLLPELGAFATVVRSGAAGTMTVINIARLSVDDLELGDGSHARGTFSVRLMGGHEIYTNIPTHHSVDLPHGNYVLRIEARDRSGVKREQVRDVSL